MSNRHKRGAYGRRDFIKGLGALAAAGAAVSGASTARLPSALATEGGPEDKTRFLIVLTANGGASIIDSTLAIRASETSNPELLNCFPDQLVQDIASSPFRAVDLKSPSLGQIPMPFSANQSNFVKKHHRDMMVATWERTSVNHFIGQRRSITGNEAWLGRTMQELVALHHGEGFALPNVHLSSGSGFTEHGNDRSIPARAFGEAIADPALWPLALSGYKGLASKPSPALIKRARELRDKRLDPASEFVKVFGQSPRIKHWRHIRGNPQESIEAQDLISKLMLFPDSPAYKLGDYGLASAPSAQAAREQFPDFETDPLHAQAALTYLLLKYRVAVTVTLGPSFDLVVQKDINLQSSELPEGTILNPPIAFDFSHQEHRAIQAFMWDRLYKIADGLITLLKREPYGSAGESLWDRTLIYFATDFGRTKGRPQNAESFATGHDLNNGVLLISPLVQGDKVLGGVDKETGMTYGFDPRTGAPDPSRKMQEQEIFAGLLQALGVDTTPANLPDMKAMRRG